VKIVPYESIPAPKTNRLLFPEGDSPLESNNEYYSRFVLWAERSGFAGPEYLLPQIWIENNVDSFLFEQRLAASERLPPSQAEVDSHAPWYYYLEWKDISTMDKEVGKYNLLNHRHRVSMFRNLAADLLGDSRPALTLLDVACSCGVTSIDFAEQGFKHVLGLELREKSVRQANFLKHTYDIKNVDFKVEDARNAKDYSADVVFCGGLLYHVTFPVQLVEGLFRAAGKFLMFDSLLDNHPFSGFHIVGERDTGHAMEGDHVIQFMPTYRAVIDLLRNAGFEQIYEVLGTCAPTVPLYDTHNIRSFLAVKPGVTLRGLLAD
jgi:hypothetical protein